MNCLDCAGPDALTHAQWQEKHPITQEDVDTYNASLLVKGTPWATGCASLVRRLWAMANRKLDKPAQVGGTIFSAGLPERMVIERAKREHEYQQTPEREAARIARSKEFCASLGNPASAGPFVAPAGNPAPPAGAQMTTDDPNIGLHRPVSPTYDDLDKAIEACVGSVVSARGARLIRGRAKAIAEDRRTPVERAVPLDAAGVPKIEPTMLERIAIEALNEVKAWRDSDGNEGFPEATRMKVDAVLLTYEQRRIQTASNG